MPPKTKAKLAKVEAKKKQDKKSVEKSKGKDTTSVKMPETKSVSKPKHVSLGKVIPITKSKSKDVPKKADPPVKVVPTKADPPVKVVPKKADSPAKVAPKRGAPATDDKKPIVSGVKKTKSDQLIVKVVAKGGAVVDSLVPNKDTYRVYQQAGKSYSATLNQSNIDNNNNKFYIIQVLLLQSSGELYLWNRWGRVGVPGQNALRGPLAKIQALKQYQHKHHQKTVKGGYKQIEIKYDDQQQVKKQTTTNKKDKSQVKSKMDQGLQKLMNLIFDINILNNTMKEIGYDAKRMPLGKLGQTTIKAAYGVLSKLSEAVKKKNQQQIKDLSSQFFTLIPHDFGFKKMSNYVLDNDQKVKEKIKMLQTISDLKITTKILDSKTDDNESILDQNYQKLGCSIKTLDDKNAQYKLLNEYFHNTKGSYSKVKIGQIYEVVRENEQKEFNKKIGNNMVLWHGSRVSNFVGILSQGLRIAPPEAPVSGYLFGKGIYLADMAEKSINYCRSHGQQSALILLIEGAIGDPNILLQSNPNAKEEMVKNKKDSTKCHGTKAPPPTSYVKHKDFIVPKGVPVATNSGSWMGHNEYIVYNMNQARIRYILRMEMNGN